MPETTTLHISVVGWKKIHDAKRHGEDFEDVIMRWLQDSEILQQLRKTPIGESGYVIAALKEAEEIVNCRRKEKVSKSKH